MTCAVLTIGTELTRGELVNGNAAWLASELTAMGFRVREHLVVEDDVDGIAGAVRQLLERNRLIVSTGGLGPTSDDLTTEAVAAALGSRLVRDPASLEQIRRRFEKNGRTMGPSNAKQADFPEHADILANSSGTAPGFGVRTDHGLAFFLPGVPLEMKAMFEEQVAPRVRTLAPDNSFQLRLHTFGLPESAIGERLQGIEPSSPGTTIGYRARFPEVEVKVLTRADSHVAAREQCARVAAEVRARLGPTVYGEGDETFGAFVGRLLRARGWSLAVAESCTGGLVGHFLTREPGASEFLLLDAVTYANSAKIRILGVDEETIRWHGAVSSEVAAAMAAGAKRVAGSDVSLSLTGIAGPSGGSDAKPVGTVYLAVVGRDGSTQVRHRCFSGGRERIQLLATYAGLEMLRDQCT